MSYESDIGRASLPSDAARDSDTLWLIALGPINAVDTCRLRLYQLGYAEPNEWSKPIPITYSSPFMQRFAPPGASNVMRVLTKPSYRVG